MARSRVVSSRASKVQQLFKHFEPNTFGEAMRAIRALEGSPLVDIAHLVGCSVSYLQDVEVDRRLVSVKRAVEWEPILHVPKGRLLRLVLQRKADDAGASVRVSIEDDDAA